VLVEHDKERADLELPWAQGTGGYSDALRIESTVVRPHPQGPGLGVPIVTRSRIGYVMENRAGQGARSAAFIVRACNVHHEFLSTLEAIAAIRPGSAGAYGKFADAQALARGALNVYRGKCT
jgi:hypothetical protein